MSSNKNVVFDENDNPIVCKFDVFASKYLMHILTMFFYLFPFTIGMFNYEFFMELPIVKHLCFILYFVADVFNLSHNSDLIIAITLVILLLPISIFFIRIINITVTAHARRRFIFFITFNLILAELAFLRVFIISVDNRFEYIFNFFVFGIFYFILVLLIPETEERKNTKQFIKKSIESDRINNIGPIKTGQW